ARNRRPRVLTLRRGARQSCRGRGSGRSSAAEPRVAPESRRRRCLNRPVTPRLTDLGDGVWSFQTPLWQTNSLLAVAEADGLLCDPALTPAEIDAIGREASRHADAGRHLLGTDAPPDQPCGIPSLPAPGVVAAVETAKRLRDGTAAAGLASGGAQWGIEWPGEVRADRVVDAGAELDCGPFRVATIDASSHGREGMGFV